ncbi:MAG: hypothetical protein JSU90_00215 [Nitrospiraceae bacterium]|nr:MAG: hypothetical protein JSU90_00215 [Nitrospiraceae bacterium]
MTTEMLDKYPFGLTLGFLIGFIIIHPFSMVFEGLLLPAVALNIRSLVHAFHPQHIPMAFFFGLLGMSLGAINVYYLKTIMKSRRQIKLLEGLLPICSCCKRIRDDAGKEQGTGKWERIEEYIYKKTDQEFTHGICPQCVEKVFPRKN